MALTDVNNPDPGHVWGKEPTPPPERQFSAIPEEQFHTYHEDNMCPERPPGLIRIHRTVARERDLRACPECVETAGPDGHDHDDEADGGLLSSVL